MVTNHAVSADLWPAAAECAVALGHLEQRLLRENDTRISVVLDSAGCRLAGAIGEN